VTTLAWPLSLETLSEVISGVPQPEAVGAAA